MLLDWLSWRRRHWSGFSMTSLQSSSRFSDARVSVLLRRPGEFRLPRAGLEIPSPWLPASSPKRSRRGCETKSWLSSEGKSGLFPDSCKMIKCVPISWTRHWHSSSLPNSARCLTYLYSANPTWSKILKLVNPKEFIRSFPWSQTRLTWFSLRCPSAS